MIIFKTPRHDWNYFLAIERDLEHLSRYIEFAHGNLSAYSIELTHILLSTSSEVDVIMKQLCYLLDRAREYENINDYREVIQSKFAYFINEEVRIDRFGLSFKPWEN
jgi:hypothetical protein